MVLNKTGGCKAKKQSSFVKKSVEIDTLDDGQLYGLITKNNGDKFDVLCSDGKTRLGKACNKVKNARDRRLKKNETFVVISLRLFEKDDKNCDIIGFANLLSVRQYAIFRNIEEKKEGGDDIIFSEDIIKTDKKDKINHQEDNFKTEEFDISDL